MEMVIIRRGIMKRLFSFFVLPSLISLCLVEPGTCVFAQGGAVTVESAQNGTVMVESAQGRSVVAERTQVSAVPVETSQLGKMSHATISPDRKQSLVEETSGSPLLKGGTTNSSKYEDALALECPQPSVPIEHQEQGVKTSCVARFNIEKDGKFNVALLSSTGSQETDDMALATLRKWKFKPAMLDGVPVKSSRKIRIEFLIE